MIILTRITVQIPSDRLPATVRDCYRYLMLADSEFDVPGPVDMLIESNLYSHALESKKDVIHSTDLPSTMNTHLGWIVGGALEESTTPKVSLSVRVIPEMNGLLQKFWTIEKPDIPIIPVIYL